MVTEVQLVDSYYLTPVLDMSMSSNGMYLALNFQSKKEILLYAYNKVKNIYEQSKYFWDLPVGNGNHFVNVDSDGSVASGVLYADVITLK